jgi:hypothetical protein
MRLRFDPSTTGDGKPKTANPIAIEDRNRRGKGVQGAGQFDFEHKSASLAAPPPPPPATEEQWEDAGFDWGAKEILERAGLTLEEADAWRERRFGVLETAYWREGGFTLEEASAWEDSAFERNRGVPNRVEEAQKLHDAGLSIEEACRWAEAVGADEYVYEGDGYRKNKYGRSGTAADTVLEWRDAGFNVEDTQSLSSANFSPADAVTLRQNGMAVEESCEWRSYLEFASAEKIIEWKEGGFSPTEAAKWSHEVIRSPSAAITLRDAGVTIEESNNYGTAGVVAVDEVIRMKNAGVSADRLLERKKKEEMAKERTRLDYKRPSDPHLTPLMGPQRRHI